MEAIGPQLVTAVVLAGGRGARMGGADKGLQAFRGVPLALHALQRLRQQTRPPDALALSANRNLAAYRSFGVPVWPDATSDHAGPLAGMLSALAHARTPLVLALPCDVPWFPLTLCERLLSAIEHDEAPIAVAASPGHPGDTQPLLQPAFCLVRQPLHADLQRFLASGGRQAGAWIRQHAPTVVVFEDPPADHPPFANANTLAELRQLEDAR